MKKKDKISAYILRSSAAALLFLCAVVALSSAMNLPNRPPRFRGPQSETTFGVNGSGSWSIVSSPNAGMFSNNLISVTCISPSQCWAVGAYDYSETPNIHLTLVERWDGMSWTIVPSPNPNTQNATLWEVTCSSASDCWAVGNYIGGPNNYGRTLIERWDGISWTITPSPNGGTAQDDNGLGGVTCTALTECWAVGYAGLHTLIERWDGTSWTIASSPDPSPSPGANLRAVTCPSPSDCWTAGFYYNGTAFQTLVEHWDGTSWAIFPSPNTSRAQNNFLYGVACTATSQCWSVGYYQDANGLPHTLIERWDGTSWTIAPSANRASDNYLFDVACASTSQCWGVGFSDGQTLVEEWDGTSWTIATSDNISGAPHNVLRGVTCSATSQCWSVGEYEYLDAPTQTLIERYIAASPTPTPTPVPTHPPFFMGEVPLGNNAYYLQFPNGTPFGYYSYLTDPRFIYHFDMGYEYWFDANDGHRGIYFYDFMSNHFFYTSPSFPFPYVYDFSLNTVLYYYPDTNNPGHYTTNPRYFFNFATGQIITM